MAKLFPTLVFLAAIGSGLIAGIFFAFSNFIMKALAEIPAAQGLPAMQKINVTVLNPLFLLIFVGTALVSTGLAITAAFQVSVPGMRWVLIGAFLYIIGCFFATLVGNVPLNNALIPADPATPAGETLWHNYLRSWTLWNHVRTVASLMACAAFIQALRIL